MFQTTDYATAAARSVRGGQEAGGMSTNKTWIRIFQISETSDHGLGYTLYKVTCTTFPLNSPEEANTVTIWKRL